MLSHRLAAPDDSCFETEGPYFAHDVPAGDVLVLDIGTCNLRVGFRSEPAPRLTLRTAVSKSRTRDNRYRMGRELLDADFTRATHRTPFQDNILLHFELLQSLLSYAFERVFDSAARITHEVFVALPLCTPRTAILIVADLLLNLYGVPVVHFAPSELILPEAIDLSSITRIPPRTMGKRSRGAPGLLAAPSPGESPSPLRTVEIHQQEEVGPSVSSDLCLVLHVGYTATLSYCLLRREGVHAIAGFSSVKHLPLGVGSLQTWLLRHLSLRYPAASQFFTYTFVESIIRELTILVPKDRYDEVCEECMTLFAQYEQSPTCFRYPESRFSDVATSLDLFNCYMDALEHLHQKFPDLFPHSAAGYENCVVTPSFLSELFEGARKNEEMQERLAFIARARRTSLERLINYIRDYAKAEELYTYLQASDALRDTACYEDYESTKRQELLRALSQRAVRVVRSGPRGRRASQLSARPREQSDTDAPSGNDIEPDGELEPELKAEPGPFEPGQGTEPPAEQWEDRTVTPLTTSTHRNVLTPEQVIEPLERIYWALKGQVQYDKYYYDSFCSRKNIESHVDMVMHATGFTALEKITGDRVLKQLYTNYAETCHGLDIVQLKLHGLGVDMARKDAEFRASWPYVAHPAISYSKFLIPGCVAPQERTSVDETLLENGADLKGARIALFLFNEHLFVGQVLMEPQIVGLNATGPGGLVVSALRAIQESTLTVSEAFGTSNVLGRWCPTSTGSGSTGLEIQFDAELVRDRYRPQEPVRLLLIGGGARLRGLADTLQDHLNAHSAHPIRVEVSPCSDWDRLRGIALAPQCHATFTLESLKTEAAWLPNQVSFERTEKKGRKSA
ncbi:Actin related protein [Giardia muris]|uniref:Actin related protein n=1 Tax=Giardia muris TaxID=5742 RepID=A0A4Z1SRP6_GIAMU|nr:Actin related protein [Giardia muris]|eukprot:TNJ28594.1 Actin related protein [Giardia muris]